MGVYNKGCVTICTGIGPSIHWFCRNFQTPPDLVVDHWTSDVESSSPLDFRLLNAMWTPFGCLMSYKIRPIISVACDFTTKSGGIWPERVTALLMVMTVCWLVSAAGEYRIRRALKEQEAPLPNHKGQRVQHPTAR